MKSGITRQYSLLTLLFAVLLLASCTKEDLVEPCDKETSGDVKNFTMNQGGGDDGHGASTTNGNDNADDDGGIEIGDDGDDLSDSERNRKKKVN